MIIFSYKIFIFASGEFCMKCNICGCDKFISGPNGRTSINGIAPCCTKCHSLERHRIIRLVWDTLIPFSSSKHALQISPEPSFGHDYRIFFLTYELSVYGGYNSLDLQQIDRNDNAYDIVICNHVLEHIPDDNKAISELLRIIKRLGIIELMVPLPSILDITRDWGYAIPEQHNHYRAYGKDIFSRFSQCFHVLELKVPDPVTHAIDYVYFLAKDIEAFFPIYSLLIPHFILKVYPVNYIP